MRIKGKSLNKCHLCIPGGGAPDKGGSAWGKTQNHALGDALAYFLFILVISMLSVKLLLHRQFTSPDNGLGLDRCGDDALAGLGTWASGWEVGSASVPEAWGAGCFGFNCDTIRTVPHTQVCGEGAIQSDRRDLECAGDV